MPIQNKIAVVSRTFSQNPELVKELQKHFVDVRFNPEKKLIGEAISEFIGDAEGTIVALEEVDGKVLDKCPNLKIVSKYGVGLNNLDLGACKERNIAVGWTGGTNKLSVAEMALCFMIGLSRNLFQTSVRLKNGTWEKDGGAQLSGRTVGIIGVGHVGKELICLLKPFHCKILVNDVIDQRDYYVAEGVTEVSKEELLAKSDFISLHVPLTSDTERMINKDTLKLVRSDAYIINTARGPLVNYADLKDALKTERIAGAAVDVYDEEPPKDKELLALDNLICTPHIGGNSKEAVISMGMAAILHLKEYFASK
ncbi:MAG: phosphoglycerate dehydrogenase [Patescibacteria group bacterium]